MSYQKDGPETGTTQPAGPVHMQPDASVQQAGPEVLEHPRQGAPGWQSIPLELRERPQWLLAAPNDKGENKVPTTVTATGQLAPGSSTNSATWLDFDYACECAVEYGYGIGYVLAEDDPYTCIDFDVKNAANEPDATKHTSPENLQRMHMLVEDLGSYTERSRSRQGVHVWLRAKFDGPGIKRRGVEVYCRERFMVCTGDVVHARPIEARQDEVRQLVATMREAQGAATRAATLEQHGGKVLDDATLMQRAWNAGNAEKFRDLWEGRWEERNYPSQSEADLALMSMLCFYTRDNEQARRLFRQSALGARDKAVKDDRYLNYTLRLIRGRQAKEAQEQEEAEAAVTALAAKAAAAQQAQQAAQPAPGGPQTPAPVPAPHPGAWAPPTGLPPLPFTLPPGTDPLRMPGAAGALAAELHSRELLPLWQTSNISVDVWLAACGFGYAIPAIPGVRPTGLNTYEIFVAQSAIGKENITANIERMVEAVLKAEQGVHMASFFTKAMLASAPALIKEMTRERVLVSVQDEFGTQLAGMADPTDGNMRGLRNAMTSMFMSSGASLLATGSIQSEQRHVISGPQSFSVVGSITPDQFYRLLTEEMMAGGFVSRFSVNHYRGPRPAKNREVPEPLPPQMVDLLVRMARVACRVKTAQGRHVVIQATPEAVALLVAFDDYCGNAINGLDQEARRQAWNRAHLKAMRRAMRACIPDNPDAPVCGAQHVAWAIAKELDDVAQFLNSHAAGDVGSDDETRATKVRRVMQEFLDGHSVTRDLLAVDVGAMRRDRLVPRTYIQQRTCNLGGFSNVPGSKLTPTDWLNRTLSRLEDDGVVSHHKPKKQVETYGFAGKLYKLLA